MEIQYSFNILDLYTLYWIHCHISLNVIFLAIWLKSPAQPTSGELLKSTRNPGQHEIQGSVPTEREH